MSDINNRNYQLKLIFGEEDLRKPKHDQIMKWLRDWVSDPENIRPFFKDTHPKLATYTVSRLLDYKPEKPNDPYHRDPILTRFEQQYPTTDEVWMKQPWPDAPRRSFSFIRAEWEVPLYMREHFDDRSMPAGFADMAASYEVGVQLDRVKVRQFRRNPEVKDYWLSSAFTELDPTEGWTEHKERKTVYFEVKTEIRSLGELMRQLQLYRDTATIRRNKSQLIVVAPPHEDARQVCADHGIHFIDYRP